MESTGPENNFRTEILTGGCSLGEGGISNVFMAVLVVSGWPFLHSDKVFSGNMSVLSLHARKCHVVLKKLSPTHN